MAEKLQVEIRETLGKRNTRRLRATGQIPGILYGHGERNVCVSVPDTELLSMVMHGQRLVALTGAVDESAFIREVQWDTWGTKVTHVDFTRISAGEKVNVQVAIELRGEAPGAKEGGVVEHLTHELQVECPAGSIPEKISVSINNLNLHDSIKVEELELAEGVVVLDDPSTTIVHCIEPIEVPEEEELGEAAAGEPEVIGAKEETEGEG
ncbi:MAG TPA: 50S ribosomal protein L25 [Thermoguttaceae bacterium]|nr:50S ribosomal protein L25 [Thermoguttaceae bacterium]